MVEKNSKSKSKKEKDSIETNLIPTETTEEKQKEVNEKSPTFNNDNNDKIRNPSTNSVEESSRTSR
jgi:hypothetical protein